METLAVVSHRAISVVVADMNNQSEIGLKPSQFRADRDDRYAGVAPPVPTPHTGMDVELADYARILRSRIVAGNGDALVTPSVANFDTVERPAGHPRHANTASCSLNRNPTEFAADIDPQISAPVYPARAPAE
ncbi:hypothetical protein [Nocardia brasiliensis]|uniref:hypothetical protein n=1 Tax=Nocardia brasiliensis TaxID=37326 RepID=UPI003D8D8C5F